MLFIVHPLYDDAAPLLSQWADGVQEFCINQKFVFADELQPNNSLPPSFIDHMDKAASVFNPSRDFLVMSGDTIQTAQFIAMLATRYPEFTILKYDRRENAYIPVLIRSHIVPPPPAVVGSSSKSGTEKDKTGHGQDSKEDRYSHRDQDHPQGFEPFPGKSWHGG